MEIQVKVKLKSKKEGIELTPEGVYEVRVHVPPIEGKANKRVIELLSDYLKKPKTSIELVRGHKSKIKVFRIED